MGSNLRQLETVSTSCSSSSTSTTSEEAVVTGTTLSVVVDVALEMVLQEKSFCVSKPYGSKGFLEGTELGIAMKEEAGEGKEEGEATHRGGRT